MAARDQVPLVTNWLTEISQAKTREKDFRKAGQKILKIYDARDTTVPFNILFSNTETLAPALYSSIPIPVVQRRFHDADPLGAAASEAAERFLTYAMDTQTEGHQTFDDVLKSATLDALLPGRAFTRLTYEAAFVTETSPPKTTDADPTTTEEQPEPVDYLDTEYLCFESRPWDRVYVGYARSWDQVPWLAFEEQIDKDEATRLFGRATTSKMRFSANNDQTRVEGGTSTKDERNQGLRKTALVYQIWDKEGGKQVRYISDAYPDGYLKVLDDPLQLTGFFPCPRPLQFIEKANNLIPTALYSLYEDQADELNELTRRIRRITKAIKARGIYDGELGGDLGKLMAADDNELIPAEKGASIAAEKGLQNAIWFMPIEALVATLTQLYQAREACKQTIFEIIGMADIMRGASKASETLGAQQLKNTWGTLRIKNKQKEVQRYVRDLLRLTLELGATKCSEETWAQMTGLPFLTQPQVQQLTQQMQAMQSMMPPPAMPMPGQPPMPAPPNPALQAIAQKLHTPQWKDVLGLLQSDTMRAYRVDIETDSTVEAAATDNQQQLTEVMTAMGQVLNGITPLVQQGILPFEAAKVLLLMIVRQYKAGDELEATINAMQPPAPQGQQDQQAQAKVQQAQQTMAEQALKVQQQQGELSLQSRTLAAEKTLLEKSIDLELQAIQLKADKDKFEMAKSLAEQELSTKDTVSRHLLASDQKVASLEAGKYKTENVVNQKADTALGKGVGEMKSMMQQLMQAMALQAEQHSQTMQQMTAAMMAPKTRKAVRGKDGRIESVTEEIAG